MSWNDESCPLCIRSEFFLHRDGKFGQMDEKGRLELLPMEKTPRGLVAQRAQIMRCAIRRIKLSLILTNVGDVRGF